jgi:putative nucleotidyltransferase with HDIG domain
MVKIAERSMPVTTIGQLIDRIAKEQSATYRWDQKTLLIAYLVLFVTIMMVCLHVLFEISGLIAALGLLLVWYKARKTGSELYSSCYAEQSLQFRDYIKQEMPQQVNTARLICSITYLATAVDAKDPYTHQHSAKVAKYAVQVASALHYPEQEVDTIRTLALLHDIGKIGIPEEILLKRGPLSEDETRQIHSHPERAVTILKYIDGLDKSLDAIRYHHERYDGSGYPKGLKGNAIPLNARIIAVADAFDALTSKRSDCPIEMNVEQAIAELRMNSYILFDPLVVDALARSFHASCYLNG